MPPGRPVWWDGRWRIEAEDAGLGVVALGPRAAAALSFDGRTDAPLVGRACLPALVALPAPPGLPRLADSPKGKPPGPVVLAIPGQCLAGVGEDHAPKRALAAALQRVKMVPAPRLPLVPVGLRVEGAIGPPYIHP
ncbi:unnamed protein product [Pararhodospirillum photometricum DSM 122]|uniref:Uncharacterized protein n=1 Tax=Pararhodospirillum photometricum DSM 122 TaxID=1150469 RepID=H6SR11_PARPM|nr:unnamed protein product [Pararhodospirillum photometricum DSM 122]